MASAVTELIPTGSLYEIVDHLTALFDSLEMVTDPRLKAEAELDIQRYLEAEVKKADNIAGYLAQCQAQQAAAKAEIERLRQRAQLWEAREGRVRQYTQSVMERFDLRKVEGNTATFSLRAAPPSVIVSDPNLVPNEFKKTTVTVSIDKTAIKKAIGAGHEVSGCDLSMGGFCLVIR
jgi:hypothetical protein